MFKALVSCLGSSITLWTRSGAAERSKRQVKLEFCPSLSPSNARIFAKKAPVFRPSSYKNEPVWRVSNTVYSIREQLGLHYKRKEALAAEQGVSVLCISNWRMTWPGCVAQYLLYNFKVTDTFNQATLEVYRQLKDEYFGFVRQAGELDLQLKEMEVVETFCFRSNYLES